MSKKKSKRYVLSEQEREIIRQFRDEKLPKEQRRFRLSGDELEAVEKYRRIRDEARAMGLDDKDVRSGWIKTKEASLNFVNPNFSQGLGYEEIRDRLIKDMAKHVPSYPPLTRPKSKDEYMFSVNLSDLHIGKLTTETGTGEAYDTKKAVKIAKEAVTSLIDTASGFNITQIVLPLGNDILHVDGSLSSTTKGTPQDTSGMWYDNFVAAREMYVAIIEMLLPIADVHLIHVPSNHDLAAGFFLSDSVVSWFSKSKNVTSDVDMRYRKYYRYGNNLIGYSHGDGAKMEQLPLMMANEDKQGWADTEYRYIYLCHVHHRNVFKFQSAKDYQGVTVEYMRSPSPADYWHHQKLYQHSQRAIEGFIHHKEKGQVAKINYHVK